MNSILLLGNKRGKGLYTREEMEIAAITGERLLDTQASAEMSRRLMRLQREQMAQTQIIDQQTRRVLHDEILPDLHAAMIGLSGDAGSKTTMDDQLLDLLAGTHRQISDLLRELPAANSPEVDRLGLMSARRDTLEQEFSPAFDETRWRVEELLARRIDAVPSMAAGVIYYAAREAIRNAAKHGRAPDSNRPLVLMESVGINNGQGVGVTPNDEQLQLYIDDNGCGLSDKADEHKEGGQGLALHSTMMAIIGGSLSISSVDEERTIVTLTFPAAESFA